MKLIKKATEDPKRDNILIRSRVENNESDISAKLKINVRIQATPNKIERRKKSKVFFISERVTGIEPVYRHWQCRALPLCYTREYNACAEPQSRTEI